MANIRTIDYKGFNHATGSGPAGFLIYSGSEAFGADVGSETTYQGVGIETVADGNNYFRFRSNPSELDIRTQKFFLGSSATSFISGSGDGTIAISSSNFLLNEGGSVIMQGTITAEAGGTIGGWNIESDGIVDVNNQMRIDSNGPYHISASGFQVDTAGAITASTGRIAGFEIDSGKIQKNVSNTTFVTMGADETSNTAHFNNGRGFSVYLTNTDAAVGATKVMRMGQIGTKDDVYYPSTPEYGFQIVKRTGASTYKDIVRFSPTEQIIGGFEINANQINSSNDNLILKDSGQITGSNVLFDGGKIGSFNIEGDILYSGEDATSATQMVLFQKPGMYMQGTDNPVIQFQSQSTDFVKMFYTSPTNFGIAGKAGGSNIFELGSTNQIAGWTFDQNQLTGGKMIINKDGTIESLGFASDVPGSGFRLTAENGGYLEVENAKIRGTLATATFEKETVNAVGGQLYVANSTVLTGSGQLGGSTATSGVHRATDTTMSVENVTGFAVGEILTAKKISDTGFQTEYIKVESSSRNESDSESDFTGKLFVVRGYSGSNPVSGQSSSSLGDLASAAQSYSGSQVIVSTGKIGTGYIRLNANPNDPATPFIDIVERTGSAIYDIDLKARLGDLSGIADSINGQSVSGFGLYTDNAFLKGGIVATYGSIGGFGISATTISSSNNNLILRDNGDITGSQVKFTGGDIGGFNIDAHSLSTTGVEINDSTQDLFISSSEFKVGHDGTFTASAGRIGNTNTGFTVNDYGIVSPASINNTNDAGLHIKGGPQPLIKINGSDLGVPSVRMYYDEANSYGFKVTNESAETIIQLGKVGGTATNTIAGWSLNTAAFEGGRMHINKGGFISSSGAGGWQISSSNDSSDPVGYISSSNFKVSAEGRITGSQVLFNGGRVGGFTIDGHSLRSAGVEINNATQDLFISSSDFQVSHEGAVTASAAYIKGVTRTEVLYEDVVVINNTNKSDYLQTTGTTANNDRRSILYLNGALGGEVTTHVKINCDVSNNYPLAELRFPNFAGASNAKSVVKIEVGDDNDVYFTDAFGVLAAAPVLQLNVGTE